MTGAPLPDCACSERSAASVAGLPCPPVGIETLYVLPLLSVHAAVVAQGRSSAFEAGSEDFDDGLGEFFAGAPADPIGGASRVDAGAPQGFVHVDVAESGDGFLAQKEALDGRLASLKPPVEDRSVEVVR